LGSNASDKGEALMRAILEDNLFSTNLIEGMHTARNDVREARPRVYLR
jgi:hypothetical protein